ncbi:MAG: AMP-binding protein [Actinobacteria bacterium]|nr:AMP-binding protein [Actinomycetota bacterium]
MTELAGADRVAPGAVEAWRRHLGEEVDVDSLRAELARGSLPQAFHETAVRYPERVALAIDDALITHGDLDRLAARAGGWLRAQGIGPGERVILCGGNSLDFVTAYLGILRAGSVVVPAGAALTEPELRHLVGDSAAACALAQGDALDRLMAIAGGDGPLRFVVALEEEEALDIPSLQREISGGEPLQPGEAGEDEAALLAYTSGTTGRPKGVPLSHPNLLSSIRAAMRAWRWDANDVLVHTLPFTHQHGLGGVHATLLSGSRAVVHSKFDPDRLCAAVESEKATVLFAVPAIYEKLAAWEGIEAADFSSLRLAVSGSAALSPALARQVSSFLGDDGYLTITGRSKELIISGGLNVYPREVELALEDHATVDKAAVAGVPSERWGEEVVAFVVPARGREVNHEELTAHAREHLSAYKCPKRFFTVEQLPRNEMGKVLQDELLDMVDKEHEVGA